jgi:hypothetical protein
MDTFKSILEKYLLEDLADGFTITEALDEYSFTNYLVESVTKKKEPKKKIYRKTKIIVNPKVSDITKFRIK